MKLFGSIKMINVTSCDVPISFITQIKEDPESILPSKESTPTEDCKENGLSVKLIPSRFKPLRRFAPDKLNARRKEMYAAVSQIHSLSRDREVQNFNVELTVDEFSLSSDALKLYRNMQGLVCNVSNIHGWGLFAARDFKANEPLIEYTGEIVRLAVAERREAMYEKSGNMGSYIFRLTEDDSANIDATIEGGPARFVNHSCDPNCATKLMTFDGVKHVVIYALEDIKKGTELCYDYKLGYELKEKRIECLCGSKNCRGWLNWSPKAENRIKRFQDYMNGVSDGVKKEPVVGGAQKSEEQLHKFGNEILMECEEEDDVAESTDSESDGDYQ